MGAAGPSFVIEITAITHRTDPIYQAFFSQMPPSTSSCIRGTGRDVALYQHLTRDLRLPVRDVHLLEAGGGAAFLAVSVRRDHPALPQRIMWGRWTAERRAGAAAGWRWSGSAAFGRSRGRYRQAYLARGLGQGPARWGDQAHRGQAVGQDPFGPGTLTLGEGRSLRGQ
jgi:hypothetical protein